MIFEPINSELTPCDCYKEINALRDRLTAAEALIENTHNLFVHYGFDKGTIAERADEVCAGLQEGVKIAEALLAAEKERDELVELVSWFFECVDTYNGWKGSMGIYKHTVAAEAALREAVKPPTSGGTK